TLAQRIVRAKGKIRDARIPYEVPARTDLPERLDAVLRVIYLVFNEGYAASSGERVTRHDLSGEAIRLGRLLVELLPEPEAQGLLALMLLHDSRRAARTSAGGEVVLLEDQDRSLWNRDQIADGSRLVQEALSSGRGGPYAIQAAIAAVHAEAATAAATDWNEIVGLYGVLMGMTPSPVIELNRAVAVAMRDGPEAGLAIIDRILARGARGTVPPARTDVGGARLLPARAGAHSSGARTAAHRAASRGAVAVASLGRVRLQPHLQELYEISLPGLHGEGQAAHRPRQRVPRVRQRLSRERAAGRGRSAAAGRNGDDGPRAQREGGDHRRPVRGDERAAGRLLTGRGARLERSAADRGENSSCTRRERRGPTGATIGAVKPSLRMLLLCLVALAPSAVE